MTTETAKEVRLLAESIRKLRFALQYAEEERSFNLILQSSWTKSEVADITDVIPREYLENVIKTYIAEKEAIIKTKILE